MTAFYNAYIETQQETIRNDHGQPRSIWLASIVSTFGRDNDVLKYTVDDLSIKVLILWHWFVL